MASSRGSSSSSPLQQETTSALTSSVDGYGTGTGTEDDVKTMSMLTDNCESCQDEQEKDCIKKLNTFKVGCDDDEDDDGAGSRSTHKCIKFRTELPAPMFEKHDVSAWSILKQCIGKELSKITMPVIFNEPLTFLQRMAEYLEYAPLLVSAAECIDPVQRLEFVTAFAVSATASNWERTGKPFNPLLGETYELNCEEEFGYRLVCEQVSHHPPISAFHAESPHYLMHTTILPKLKFWGKSVEVTPKGIVTLQLFKHGEVYTWQNVSCSVNNVIVGKLWIEHYGTLEVLNQKTKHKAVLNFKQNDMLGKDLFKVEGYLHDSSDRKLRAFYGKWVEALYSYDVDVWESYIKRTRRSQSPSVLAFAKATKSSDDVPSRGSSCNLHLPGQKLLWEAKPRPANSSQYYSFTEFSMCLNELHPRTCVNLPPTDCRFRPDLRLFEQGDLDGAQVEKNRVEEKQRLAKHQRKKGKDEWEPKWFKHLGINALTGKEDWQFTGEYWKRDWSRCQEIF